jgi:hypothetical protein
MMKALFSPQHEWRQLVPGGDRSRQRMSSEVKRAEEGDDDLVNHMSQKTSADSHQREYALAR